MPRPPFKWEPGQPVYATLGDGSRHEAFIHSWDKLRNGFVVTQPGGKFMFVDYDRGGKVVPR